jgi:metallo-beta-lactamase family protein
LRRIVERRSELRIFGQIIALRAEVVSLDGFSAHADQAGLLDWAGRVARRGRLERVVLVHGEPRPQEVLARLLREKGVCARVDLPTAGDRIRLA